jgi:hypothetical protein
MPSSIESGSSTLRGALGARFFFSFCVWAPLQLEGIMGKNITPSIGWEVSVRSHRLASGSKDDH